MSLKSKVSVTADVVIEVFDEDAAKELVERVTGPNGDEWRSEFYEHIKEGKDVLEHLAWNCVNNGIVDAYLLEGFADLQPGAVTMQIEDLHAQLEGS